MSAKAKKPVNSGGLDPAYVKAVKAAQAEVDAGRTVSYAKVRRWLLSWGTKKELPPPRCK